MAEQIVEGNSDPVLIHAARLQSMDIVMQPIGAGTFRGRACSRAISHLRCGPHQEIRAQAGDRLIQSNNFDLSRGHGFNLGEAKNFSGAWFDELGDRNSAICFIGLKPLVPPK